MLTNEEILDDAIAAATRLQSQRSKLNGYCLKAVEKFKDGNVQDGRSAFYQWFNGMLTHRKKLEFALKGKGVNFPNHELGSLKIAIEECVALKSVEEAAKRVDGNKMRTTVESALESVIQPYEDELKSEVGKPGTSLGVWSAWLNRKGKLYSFVKDYFECWNLIAESVIVCCAQLRKRGKSYWDVDID